MSQRSKPGEPTVEELLSSIDQHGYEAPVIDQVNPELRTTKYASITAYQMPQQDQVRPVEIVRFVK